MTEFAIVQTSLVGAEAGSTLGREIRDKLSGAPDALIVFASPENDYEALLAALSEAAGTETIVGCSTAGEFINGQSGQGLTNVTAIRSENMKLTACVGTGLSADSHEAGRLISESFRGSDVQHFPFRSALVLVDALAGHAEELIESLTVETAGTYRFFGGGAGDNALFRKTYVFCGRSVYSDAAVALEILSRRPVGIGARHGWDLASPPLRVTEAEAANLRSLNAAPAAEVFEEHAEATSQPFDRADPLPFFLHNIIGVETDSGYKLRVPLGITDDGCVACAAEVPTGATTHIMSTSGDSAAAAAGAAARDAMQQVRRDGGTPKAALFFDCVATRLRLGRKFEDELETVTRELGELPFAGFNSYGQIVRSEGQFSGFHNCTAVVCVFPE